ncbi:Universal stress protein UspA-related nucleotide-binding protein [Archaeoglobus sulfaticallidus PM70-1]|uniref:Universal stress protein UspA-related nucleotide-binding protein n=1 Tax=Archaeoglobus sulfaticallidus PM70-1 TaxID=387631 RepID=N0BAN6_9EURY|nr:universal stress protein [Archaeoglobus sulfaticallidus]AGK60674.1 Universal stress protein UspA-related nucleotide-binding protein [Archaeoglobus sulfaticallidus PM70-1]
MAGGCGSVDIDNFRIIVATDGTEASEKAVRFAVELARSLDYDLHAVSVVCNQLKRQKAEETLDYIKKMHPRTHVAVKEGKPAEEIVSYAKEINANLIVVGSGDKSRLERLFIGSVSEKVVRHAKTSVLVARSSALPKRVLVTTDGSECSNRALRWVQKLKERIPFEVTVLHVMDTSDPAPSQLYLEELQRRRDCALGAAREIFGDSAEYVSMKGHPVFVIVAISADYDLVVLGSHGRSGIDYLLLGSVAERVVRFSRTSTLVLRNKKLNTE